jgi:hypothetical protein
MAILIASICMQIELGYAATEEISYRLLDFNRRQFGDTKIANYAISIDRFLDRPQIEQLICQILQKEKPTYFSILSIEISYNLDKRIPPVLPNLDRELMKHLIAGYQWNIELPNDSLQLMIFRDVQGNFLDPPQFYDFDHTKACKR